MKKFLLLLTIALAILAGRVPIVVDLVGADGTSVYPDSAACLVLSGGDTLLVWTAMDTAGRSPCYEYEFPETLTSAVALVAAFWEDSLADTTAFAIFSETAPVRYAAAVEDTLSSMHGEGSWKSSAVMPFLLTMTEEEILATFGDGIHRPISIYRGDSRTIDFRVTDASGDSVDLSGAEAIFTARSGESDTAAAIIDTLEITDGPAGVMRLSLSPEQTDLTPRSYPADVQVTFPDSTVHTLWRSRLTVEWDVGR